MVNKDLKSRILGGTARLMGGAAALALVGCTDVGENHVAVRKTYGGEVHFHDGPQWDYLGRGTDEVVWDGRRIIELPLTKGTEASQHYSTADGYLIMDLTAYYQIGKSDEQRNQWFVKITNAKEQFPQVVDGIVRSTVKTYTSNEILNEERAKENGKLPIYQQIQLDLARSDKNVQYGINPELYAVWPGNISPLRKSVQADLERQRQIILRTAQADAQQFKEKALVLKAEVDGEYSEFIKELTPAQHRYLQTLEMVSAIKSVGKAKGQDVDVNLFVE